MIPELYVYLAVPILLTTVGRIVWRRGEKTDDRELAVAFIRLDFPPAQRAVAQKIAAGLAEIVGEKIKELRPENTLEQIAEWADSRIFAGHLIKLLRVAYDVSCEPQTSFRSVVEQVVERQTKNSEPEPNAGGAV
jgi:hypothetical protein